MAKAELMNYEQALEQFEVVIGLEVHVELNTNTKMFCGCKNEFGNEPNTNVCPICIALPGALPAVNKTAVESSIKIGLALGCEIAPTGRFARNDGCGFFHDDHQLSSVVKRPSAAHVRDLAARFASEL